jgi:acyl-coenzyme A thioesterase 13
MPHDSPDAPDAPDASTQPEPPEGYLPLFRSSAFVELVGPLFYRPEDDAFRIGLRVLEQHLNSASMLHGGLIATLADVSLGYVTAFSRKPALSMVTASLSIDYLGAAPLGSWVESRVAINQVGQHLAFADAVITSGDRPVAKARALFAIADRVQAAAGLGPGNERAS